MCGGVCVCRCLYACECLRGRSVIITVSIIIYTFVFFGFTRAKDVRLDYIRPGDMISDMHACSVLLDSDRNIVRFSKAYSDKMDGICRYDVFV